MACKRDENEANVATSPPSIPTIDTNVGAKRTDFLPSTSIGSLKKSINNHTATKTVDTNIVQATVIEPPPNIDVGVNIKWEEENIEIENLAAQNRLSKESVFLFEDYIHEKIWTRVNWCNGTW